MKVLCYDEKTISLHIEAKVARRGEKENKQKLEQQEDLGAHSTPLTLTDLGPEFSTLECLDTKVWKLFNTYADILSVLTIPRY